MGIDVRRALLGVRVGQRLSCSLLWLLVVGEVPATGRPAAVCVVWASDPHCAREQPRKSLWQAGGSLGERVTLLACD